MNFDPASQDSSVSFIEESHGCSFCDSEEFLDLDIYSTSSQPTEIEYTPPISLVEATVVDAIIMGSGGPENGPITDAGLRFVRHIISQSRASNAGFLPNLKDMNCIKELARGYIAGCGSGTGALETMYTVMHL